MNQPESQTGVDTAGEPVEIPIRRYRGIIGLVLAGYWLALFVGTHIPVAPKALFSIWDKLLHFGAYCGLAYLLALWISSGSSNQSKLYGIVPVVIVVYAIIDELLQMPVNRTADFYDGVADLAGSLVGLGAFHLTRKFLPGLWERSAVSSFAEERTG